jgi:hypothetical protein
MITQGTAIAPYPSGIDKGTRWNARKHPLQGKLNPSSTAMKALGLAVHAPKSRCWTRRRIGRAAGARDPALALDIEWRR